MIGKQLRKLCTYCWLVIADPARNGLTSTLRMPSGYSMRWIRMTRRDRAVMQNNLRNKYGIGEIE